MLGKGVAKYYRNNVKGNYYADTNLIQKKLTRNIMLTAEKYNELNKLLKINNDKYNSKGSF